MVTSDAHDGILYAMKEQFPDTPKMNQIDKDYRDVTERRSNIIVIFSSQGPLLRLIGGVLIQEHESWSSHSWRFYQPTYREIEACKDKLRSLPTTSSAS